MSCHQFRFWSVWYNIFDEKEDNLKISEREVAGIDDAGTSFGFVLLL